MADQLLSSEQINKVLDMEKHMDSAVFLDNSTVKAFEYICQSSENKNAPIAERFRTYYENTKLVRSDALQILHLVASPGPCEEWKKLWETLASTIDRQSAKRTPVVNNRIATFDDIVEQMKQ